MERQDGGGAPEGRAMGEQIVRRAAEALKDSFRSSDCICRICGLPEYLISFDDCGITADHQTFGIAFCNIFRLHICQILRTFIHSKVFGYQFTDIRRDHAELFVQIIH